MGFVVFQDKIRILISCVVVWGKIMSLAGLRKFVCNLISVSFWVPSISILLLWGF